MYQISLIAAFIAGMVALFAPCCITYLLPAYFGSIFKERKRVLLMTTVYTLGIATVMLPIVLGAKALASTFFRLHDQTYIVGSVLMMIVAFTAFLGVKLPMPNFQTKKKAVDIPSIYSLGLISGITSSCCAPVLVGVITLSSFSPTLLQSFGVGASYVIGMVAPLYLASLFLDKGNILNHKVFKTKLTSIQVFSKSYSILVGNVIASAIFLLTGITMFILAMQGKLGMDASESETIKNIQSVAFRVTDLTSSIPLKDLLFSLILTYLIYKLIRHIRREK